MIRLARGLLLGLEAAWWAMLLGGLSAITDGSASWGGWLPTALLLSVAYLTSQLVYRFIPEDRTARLLFLGGGVVAVPVAIGLEAAPSAGVLGAWWLAVGRLRLDPAGPAGVLQVLLLLILWVRGGNLARRAPRLADAVDAFQIGLIVALVAGLVGLATARPLALDLVLALFGFGLSAMAVSRAAERLTASEDRSSVAWFVSVTGTLALICGLGLALSAIASADVARALLDAAGGFGYTLLLLVLVPLVYAFGWLAMLVFDLMRVLLERIGPLEQRAQPPNPATWDLVTILRETSSGIPTPLAQLLGWLLGAATVGVALVLTYRAIAARGRQAITPHEHRERVAGFGSAVSGLMGMLGEIGRSVLGRGRHRVPPARADMTVRELYRIVLLRLRAEGIGRAPTESPADVEPRIAARYAATPATALTRAYEAERYGNHQTTEERKRALIARWRALLVAKSNGPGTPR